VVDWRRRSLAAFLLPVLFLGLVCTAGCLFGGDEGDDDDDDPDDVVWPLDIGNWWTYDYYTLDQRTQFTVEATETVDVSGTTVTKVEYVDYVVDDYYILVRNATGGVYFYGDPIFGETATPDLWVKYPCTVGDTWQTSHQGALVDWEVIATAQSVTVPDGTYSCIHIRGTNALNGRSYADHWYSVGTGWIRMTQGALTIELVDKDIQ
jgi:hypothetical protein